LPNTIPTGRERRHPELIGLQEAADRTGLCYRTIRRYIASGRLNAVRVGPRLLKVDAAAVEALKQPVGGAA
jgi:excisionase family DNA binding protein